MLNKRTDVADPALHKCIMYVTRVVALEVM